MWWSQDGLSERIARKEKERREGKKRRRRKQQQEVARAAREMKNKKKNSNSSLFCLLVLLCMPFLNEIFSLFLAWCLFFSLALPLLFPHPLHFTIFFFKKKRFFFTSRMCSPCQDTEKRGSKQQQSRVWAKKQRKKRVKNKNSKKNFERWLGSFDRLLSRVECEPGSFMYVWNHKKNIVCKSFSWNLFPHFVFSLCVVWLLLLRCWMTDERDRGKAGKQAAASAQEGKARFCACLFSVVFSILYVFFSFEILFSSILAYT